MLFKKLKLKKQSVLQLTALLLAAAFAFVVAACPGEEIGGVENQTPTAADFDIGNLNQLEGSVTAVTVTPKAGKSNGAVTVFYDGNTTLPTTVGTYVVTFNVAATAGWNAAAGLQAGNLIIGDPNKPTPVPDDYNISNLIQTFGSVTEVTVTPKAGKSPGTVTVYYVGIDGTFYPKSRTVPTAIGTYAVIFDVAAATEWNAASSLQAGTLFIDDSPKNYVSELSWGVSTTANVLTLGLTPGDDTTKINLNWYSTGSTASKVAKVRFIKGTLASGTRLIEAEGTVSAVADGTSYTAHKVTVTGLQKGASYKYAVSSDGDNWSDTYDFKIPAGNTFKFAVIADPQLHNTTWDANNRYIPASNTTSRTAQGWLATMAKIVNHGVSFIASGGDQVDTTNSGSEAEYTMFFAPPGLRNLPFAPVSGNHDGHNLYTFHYNWPNAQVFSGETTQYDLGSRNYYYLYNNILFVVLNTAPYPTSTSLAQPIVNRFEETIKAALAAHPKEGIVENDEIKSAPWDWLIVQHHKSTASVADHLADTDIQYYVEAGFETVMSKYKVDFVLAGHDHVYARSYPLEGKGGGMVSEPDKSNGDSRIYTNPGKPIYLTFTTGSGLKYYQVATDKQFPYNNTLYVKDNLSYPYLGDSTADNKSTAVGSAAYLTKQYLPVSNAAWVQPYIPSYCIVEVNGKTIKFSTYPIISASGTSSAIVAGQGTVQAEEAYSYNENTPYDWVQVTKTN